MLVFRIARKGDTQQQKVLNIVYLPFLPWMIATPDNQLGGVDAEVWSTIASRMNLSINYFLGRSFNEAIAMARRNSFKKSHLIHAYRNCILFSWNVLQTGNGTMDVTASQPNIDVWSRGRLAAISPCLFERDLGFVVQKPKRVDSFYTLAMPFDKFVWICVALSPLLIFVVLWARNLITSSTKTSTFHLLSLSVMPLLSESLPLRWYQARSNLHSYIILMVWLSLATLLSFAYESNLLSSLVSVSYEKPIETFEELGDSGMPVHVLTGSAIELLMKYSHRGTVRRVYQTNVLEKGSLYDFENHEGPYEATLNGEGTIITTVAQVYR